MKRWSDEVSVHLRVVLLASLAGFGCRTRDIPAQAPVFADVEETLSECLVCHGPDVAEAGWRADGYLQVVGCPDGSGPAVEPADARAPILAVLARVDHQGLLTEREEIRLREWVSAGAIARVGVAHLPGWIDPRSADFHGVRLGELGWAPMLSEGAGACSTCHRMERTDPGLEAEGATPCFTCHTDEDGPFACSTCHGQPGRDHPPRDPCFHPDESGGAHAGHAEANVDCSTCHGERTIEQLGSSLHGDSVVQVVLDPRTGMGATWDPIARACAGTCHDRGGDVPTPSWDEELDLDCQSCHLSPPDAHYAGSCNECHAEASASGDALIPGSLHANGQVDVGDGSSGCAACHGSGVEGWPTSGAHAAHRSPELAQAIACAECHLVPESVFDDGHLDDALGAEVVFGPRASAREQRPVYDAGGCRDVACHGGGLTGGTLTAPEWEEEDAPSRCGACHGLPPDLPHSVSRTCAAIGCHGGFVGPGPSLTEAGRAVHADGVVDLWRAP